MLDTNRKLQNENDGYSKSREVRRVASIPAVVQQEWVLKYGYNPVTATDKTLLRKLLNSYDWAYLRTAPGRL